MSSARLAMDGTYETARAEWGQLMDERIRRFTAGMSPEERQRKAADGMAAMGRILSRWQEARTAPGLYTVAEWFDGLPDPWELPGTCHRCGRGQAAGKLEEWAVVTSGVHVAAALCPECLTEPNTSKSKGPHHDHIGDGHPNQARQHHQTQVQALEGGSPVLVAGSPGGQGLGHLRGAFDLRPRVGTHGLPQDRRAR